MNKAKFFLSAVVILIITAGIAFAAPITKPHTFVSGNPANAEDVNANFDVVYEKINELDNETCSEQTFWVPIAPYAFQDSGVSSVASMYKDQTDAWLGYRGAASAPYIKAFNGLSYAVVRAQIPLPEKAVLLRSRVFIEDNSDSQNIRCYYKLSRLSTYDSDGISLGASITSGAEEGVRTFEKTFAPYSINYYDKVFGVSCDWSGDSEHENDLGLYGVAVEYRLPSTCE